MSTPFPKKKEKRPRPTSEPNKSFVKNVTSRVSGLLPATITKWFSSPSSSNTNGSAQVADATDSSTEDEAPESPITIQPPAKRARYNSPGEFNQLPPVETRCTSTNTESIDEPYTVHSPIGRSNIQRDNIFISTCVNSNDDTTEQAVQDSSFFKPPHSLSAIEHTMGNKRKSLFGTPQDDFHKNYSQSSSGNLRDPYFKPSLLSSPFYVGRTMYGGATSSYLTSPSIKPRKINLTNETSNHDSVNMSHSARRVMDLLEHYSSPLIEAKRIPQITRDREKCNPNNSLQQSVNPYGPKTYSYKTQELYVPSVANILTIKRKSRLMDTTNAARQIIASHSSSSEYLPYSKSISGNVALDEVSGDKLTTKVKSRLTRTNRERNIEIESTSSDTVNLPNVVLQIDKDNLPKFTFGPISTSQPTQSSSIQTPVIITPEALKRTTESVIPPEALKKTTEFDKSDFSKPRDVDKDKLVHVTSESNKTSTTTSKVNYESNFEKVQEVVKKDDLLISNSSNQIIRDSKSLVQNSSDWKCLDCWVTNKSDVDKCKTCGGNRPVEVGDDGPKQCSVCNISMIQQQCDKCAVCEKKTNNIDKPLLSKETNITKWKCSDCWVDNNESAEKCVCCGGRNPKKIIPATVINSVEKVVESEWKCNDCWIKNKSTLTKCAACGGPKPGKQPSGNFGNNALPKDTQRDNKVKETLDNTFKDIANAQSEKWECPLCLVRNESNRLTCICCEASKPGTAKESHTKFNFHQPAEITFKFGIQPKIQETCTDIEPEECNMGEESETNNNILLKTPTFNFGLPVKKFGDLSQLPMDKLAEAPKLNFTFGVSKETTVTPVSNTIFGIPSKLDEASKKAEEKPQEDPQVFTSSQPDEPLTKNLGLFNTAVTSQVAPEMPALVLNQSSSANKDIPFLSTGSTNSEVKTQQNNFTFPSIMPATNLFATPTATTTTTISSILSTPLSMSIPATSTVTLFQKPNVVTTTTASFFQKSEPLGVSMFLKNETKTTASSVSMGMQPVFSFGGQGSLPQPAEKPKFNFGFTNNKTEPATIFKPTFGASTESNISSNNFNLTTNSIIGGNALSGNPLNTTTQMNTNSPLTTGNSLTTPSASSIFGTTVQKENMWPSSTNNIFAANTTTNEVQKPSTFTFGTATPFNANNTAFGTSTQQPQPTQTPQNIFGMAGQTPTSQPALFGNQLPSQTPPSIFGGIQVQNNPMPMGIFGTPNPGVTPSFGAINPPIPQFETSSLPPAPAPSSFNFGGQPSTGIFGFGQQQQQASQGPPQPENQTGMYGFGAPSGPGSQMQFTIGSAPSANTAGRRVRKAMRRTQR